ncbi:MAG: L-threonylcarbamoyladenylate synthase, partial [Candidatus Ranarchaeia archaeon]
MNPEKKIVWEFSCGHVSPTSLEKMSAVSQLIRSAGVIVFPTDTVYGIGCSPFKDEAVEQVLKAKNRRATKGLPILVADLENAHRLAVFTEITKKIVAAVWPGNVTLVLPLRPSIGQKISSSVTGGRNTIAIRVPGLAFTRELIRISGGALVGTSANVSGSPPISSIKDLVKTFSDKVNAIILCKKSDGTYEAGSGKPSTIIDLTED